jgi:hypothetical protein
MSLLELNLYRQYVFIIFAARCQPQNTVWCANAFLVILVPIKLCTELCMPLNCLYTVLFKLRSSSDRHYLLQQSWVNNIRVHNLTKLTVNTKITTCWQKDKIKMYQLLLIFVHNSLLLYFSELRQHNISWNIYLTTDGKTSLFINSVCPVVWTRRGY